MLHVTEADVKRLLPLSKAIELVREAYVRLARGEAANPPRVLLSVPGGASMFFMPGYVYGQGAVPAKVQVVKQGIRRTLRQRSRLLTTRTSRTLGGKVGGAR